MMRSLFTAACLLLTAFRRGFGVGRGDRHLLHLFQGWEIGKVFEIEQLQKLGCRVIQKRPPWNVLAGNNPHQPPFQKSGEYSVHVDASYSLDLGPDNRLLISDDSQCL